MTVITSLSRLSVESFMSMPPPAGSDDESCSKLNAEIGTAFGDNQVSRDAAKQLVEQKISRMPDNETTCYQMIVDDLIQKRLPTRPDMAKDIVNWIANGIIIKSAYSQNAKTDVMAKLANMYGTFTSAQATQKTAIEDIFETVKGSGREDAFLAGISSVYKIDDDDNKLTHNYILTFNAHAVTKDDAIGKNTDIINEYLNAVGTYSDKQSLIMLPIVQDTMSKWFDNPDLSSLWLALMEMSKVDKMCALETGEEDQLNVAVESKFRKIYDHKSLPEQKVIAAEVVKHLNDTWRNGIAPAHVNLLDYLLARGPKEVREEMLKALREVTIESANEMPVVRCYLKLIYSGDDDLRTNAILQGANVHEFNHKVINYLISLDASNLRNPAHNFITDYKPIGGEVSVGPIIEYGIKQISEVEEVCKEAPSEIVPQCEMTINLLYREYRKHHSLIQSQVKFAPAVDFFGLDNPMERNSSTAGITLDYLSKSYPGQMRLLLGGEASTAYTLNAVQAGLRTGFGMDVSDDFFFKLAFGAGYLRMTGEENDMSDVTYEVTKDMGEGDYKAKTKASSFTMQGGYLGVEPEVVWNLRRVRDGGGKTHTYYLAFGGRFSVFRGTIKEDKPMRSFRPDGDFTYDPNDSLYLLDRNEGSRARNDGIWGYEQALIVSFGIEWL